METRLKHIMLIIFIHPVAFFLRIFKPFEPIFKRIYFTACLKSDIWDTDITVQCDGRVYVNGTKNITLGKRCRLGMDTELSTVDTGHIHLGNDIRVNRGTTLVSYAQIYIDDFTIIGEFVSIRDANHGMIMGEPMRYQKHIPSPIRIGRDVWIGRGSCILPGVSIGEGSIIGANSVVTSDIPSYTIAAGVPAKVLKDRD